MEIGSREWKNIIFEGARYLDVQLEAEQLSKFTDYVSILLSWNKKINLTAITNPFEIATKHILDSIAPYQFINNAASMLDLGSGAGFPGIPLKITIPELKTTLLDSSRKKVNFQKYVIRELGLTDIFAVHARVSGLSTSYPSSNVHAPVDLLSEIGQARSIRKRMSNQFEVIVCRALFSLKQYVMSALPLVTPTGRLVALKADIYDSEMQSLNACLNKISNYRNLSQNSFHVSVHQYRLPYIDAKRSIIIVQRK